MATLRKYTLDRWNWSEREEKWDYLTKKNGRRVYSYQVEPPEEFLKLTKKLDQINHKLLHEQDYEQNQKLYKEMMVIAEKMQAMRRGK